MRTGRPCSESSLSGWCSSMWYTMSKSSTDSSVFVCVSFSFLISAVPSVGRCRSFARCFGPQTKQPRMPFIHALFNSLASSFPLLNCICPNMFLFFGVASEFLPSEKWVSRDSALLLSLSLYAVYDGPWAARDPEVIAFSLKLRDVFWMSCCAVRGIPSRNVSWRTGVSIAVRRQSRKYLF